VVIMIRYDTRCYFNVRSKADIVSQLNLPHGTNNENVGGNKKIYKLLTDKRRSIGKQSGSQSGGTYTAYPRFETALVRSELGRYVESC